MLPFSFWFTVTAVISDLNQMPVTVILELMRLSYANASRSYALIVRDERLG